MINSKLSFPISCVGNSALKNDSAVAQWSLVLESLTPFFTLLWSLVFDSLWFELFSSSVSLYPGRSWFSTTWSNKVFVRSSLNPNMNLHDRWWIFSPLQCFPQQHITTELLWLLCWLSKYKDAWSILLVLPLFMMLSSMELDLDLALQRQLWHPITRKLCSWWRNASNHKGLENDFRE